MAKLRFSRRDDIRIEAAFQKRCSGIQIGVMDIGRIYTLGREAIAAGATDQELGDKIHELAESIARAERIRRRIAST